MKKLLFLLGLIASTAISFAQTGTGILFLTDASYTFTPTTVDSTTVFDFQLVNTVGVSQTLYFDLPVDPFSLSDEGPIEIAANDTIDLSLSFTPASIGTFTGTLGVVGNIFGAAELALTGQGIQVVLEWTPSELAFDTTAIGQQSAATLSISSIGDGAGTISDVVFSNNIFSLDPSSSLSIAEGTTEDLTFLFSPIGAGVFNETVQLHTNDPNNPIITIPLMAVGISEVSGEVCDVTWSLADSPFTLVGDVTVPEGCSLTIEPGVVVLGPEHRIISYGSFGAFGTAESLIEIEVDELVSHSDSFQLAHCSIVETSQLPSLTSDLRVIRNQTNQSNLANFLASFNTDNLDRDWLMENYDPVLSTNLTNPRTYFNNFSMNDACEGWSVDNSAASTCDGEHYAYRSYSNWHDYAVTTPEFQVSAGIAGGFSKIKFDLNRTGTSNQGGSEYTYIQYKVEDGGWELIPGSSYWYGDATDEEVELLLNDDVFEDDSNEDGVITIQFRWYSYRYHYSQIRIDNFQLFAGETEFTTDYGSEAIETSQSLEGLDFLSTGSMEVSNCSYSGDIEFLGFNNTIEITSSSIYQPAGGVMIQSDVLTFDVSQTHISSSGSNGIVLKSEAGSASIVSSTVEGSAINGIDCDMPQGSISVQGCQIQNNSFNGVRLKSIQQSSIKHSLIEENGQDGINLTEGMCSVLYSNVSANGGNGVTSSGPLTLSHVNIMFNEGNGLHLWTNDFHSLKNSILWGNDVYYYNQINITSGVLSANYTDIQGYESYGVTGSGQLAWGQGIIDADPLFADSEYHLNVYSLCVDGGEPWTQDAHMPYGLGGVRADMGMYGGPDNAYWGGLALPDGASNLLSVEDTPQDQGNTVGLTFSSSFYDNSDLVNNVTHYAFWRHFDPTGAPISSVDEGNWELIGEMPSLSLANYAYQASTLGNSNAFGDFSSCYFVAAHTADDDTYWISNVACGEAIDNLAPESPDLNGLVLETGGTQISWTPPAEEDYAFTEIFSDAGFTASIGTDTVVVDLTAELGGPVTYTAVHYDVNGNASESSSLTLDVAVGTDVIQLNAGWNLISFDRSLTDASVAEVFSGLQPGNLQYVTGFQEGVQFYDPNGLSFLNTLGTLDDGYGYWVKVAADDVLEASGAGLPANYRPQLNAGWNLIGYPNATEADPAAYFADLIADENLVYVTGFDEGSQVFDPNGLAFLNTLQMLQNGFGYWVKTNAGEDLNGLAESQTKSSPTFMILNGHSDLQAAEGERVDVLNADGERVAQLEVLEGGYLMTSAVFGFDPAAPENGGLRTGDVLTFVCNGRTADQTITYQGDMTHRALELTFSDLDAAAGFSVAPNPARAVAWVEVDLVSDARIAVQINDALGRTLREISFGDRLTGPQELQLDLTGLTPGTYELSLLLDGRISGSSRLLIQQ